MDDNIWICTNEIHSTLTPALFRYLKEHGVSLADAAATRQASSDAHTTKRLTTSQKISKKQHLQENLIILF